MNLQELMNHLRCNTLRDAAQPYLWSDKELLGYLNEAEALFATRTHILSDDDDPITTFDTVAGQSAYALDPTIVYVSELGLVIDNGSGDLTYRELCDRTRKQLGNNFSQGMPKKYNLQVARHKVRFYPVPDDVYTVQMVVARKPLSKLSNGLDTPEIPEEHHTTLTNYAAWKALSNNDPEGSNMAAAAAQLAMWDLVIRDVKRDMGRLRSGAHPRVRANWTGKRR